MTLRITVRVSQNRFPEIIAKAPRILDGAARKAAHDVNISAEESMSESKSGRLYYIKGMAGWYLHQASAPGESPAIVTQTLVNSLRVYKETTQLYFAYTNDPKADDLEYGAVRIRPRPFYLPAAHNVFSSYVNDCIKALKGI